MAAQPHSSSIPRLIHSARLTPRYLQSPMGSVKWWGAMRCIGCGEEMRLVQAVADHTMMVRGYEHHTLECPGCHEVERRLVFAKPIEPTPIEPTTNLTSVEPTRASPGAQPAAPTSTATPKEIARAPAPSTWERALDRLRSQQSSLDERAAGAKSSETKRQLHQTWDGKTSDGKIWDGFKPRRHDVPSAKAAAKAAPSLAQQPAQPVATATRSGKDGSQHAATPTGALARVAARRPRLQACRSADSVRRLA